jgi:DNA-binding MarR family transcriptional regulator
MGMEKTHVELGKDLLQLTLLCRNVDRMIAASADLSVDELHCLVVLNDCKPCRVKDLYEVLGFSATKTSKVFHSLEGRGYLRRELQQSDRRLEEVMLTEAGAKAAQRILVISNQVARQSFVSISKNGGPLFSYLACSGD